MSPQISAESAETFVGLADIPTDRAVLTSGEWVFSCGLGMLDASIRDTPDDHYVTRNAAIMRLAHTRHHDGLDTDFVKPSQGESHDPAATIYFQSRNIVLRNAWCSCGFTIAAGIRNSN